MKKGTFDGVVIKGGALIVVVVVVIVVLGWGNGDDWGEVKRG